jgi:hypothetical protein
MSALLWRVLIAVICVVIAFALIPPVSHILGFPIDGDVLTVIRVVIAGLAALYIFKGPPFPA